VVRADESTTNIASPLVALAVALVLAVLPCPARAAEPFPFDPLQMLEQMFGPDDQEDEQALAAVEISRKEERTLGREAAQSYLAALRDAKIPVSNRSRDVAYLRRLAEQVRLRLTHPEACPPLTVYLIESEVFEARAFSDGTLVFSRGALEMASSEAALVGLIGHELSHLDRRHLISRLRRMKLAQARMRDARAGDLQAKFSAGMALTRLWTRPYRPEDEQQADLDGARWAYQAGYDPRELASLIETAAKSLSTLPLPGFLRSHPVSAERVETLRELYAQLQKEDPKAKLYVGRENLRRRITRAEKEIVE